MNEHKIDIKGMALGRAASEVAKILIGKDSTSYAPNKLPDNRVVVSNVESIVFSGRKAIQKKYYRHSGKIGNLKEEVLEDRFKADAKKTFTHTVKGMLPKNKLAAEMIKKMRYE